MYTLYNLRQHIVLCFFNQNDDSHTTNLRDKITNNDFKY